MDRIEQLVTGLWADPVPRAVLIVIASLIAALLVDFVVTRTILLWTRRTKTKLDEKIVGLLHGPIVKTIFLGGLWYATRELELGKRYESPTQASLLTIGLLIWMVFAFRFTGVLLDVARDRQDRFAAIEPRTYPLFSNLSKLVLVGAGAYLLILIWDIDATGWLASAGIVGIALGFAAKDTLANLFAGVFVIADAPYRVGDFIVLGSGERGQVIDIGLRSTRILTRDDIEITIPNAVIGSSMVTNETGGPSSKRRVRVQVSVAYGSDVDQVRELLMDVAREVDHVVMDPEPRVRFRRFGESGLEFELLCWIDQPVLRGRSLDALNTATYKRLMAEGVEIPYPKRDVYIKEQPNL